jgi:hypothetical protein
VQEVFADRQVLTATPPDITDTPRVCMSFGTVELQRSRESSSWVGYDSEAVVVVAWSPFRAGETPTVTAFGDEVIIGNVVMENGGEP